MHFGDFNPLEVLANAAVQRGVDNASSATDVIPATTSSDVTSTSVNNDGAGQETQTSSSVKAATTEASNLAPLSVVTTQANSAATKPVAQNTAPYVVKMVAPNTGSKGGKAPVVALKDATKIVIPNKDGSSKTLTVLKINKGTAASKPGQSIQYVIDRKGDDDEGYCSRSSLDSPGQCTRSDYCDRDADVRSPNASSNKVNTSVFSPQSPKVKIESAKLPVKTQVPSDSMKKPAKIVIVSRDSVNSKTFVSKLDSNSRGAKTEQPANATVLRTLLGASKDTANKANLVLKNDGSQTLSGSDSQGSRGTQQTLGHPGSLSATSQSSQQTLTQNETNASSPLDTTTTCDNNKQTVHNDNSGQVDKSKNCSSVLSAQQQLKSDPNKSHNTTTIASSEQCVAPSPELSQVSGTQPTGRTGIEVTNAAKSLATTNQASLPGSSSNKDSVTSQQSGTDIDGNQGNSKMRERKGSFQNAFKSFIGTEKQPAEKVTAQGRQSHATVLSSNLLCALKQQGNVTVSDSAASAEIKGKSAVPLDNSKLQSGVNNKINRSATPHTNKDTEEEIIDVMSVDETTTTTVKDGGSILLSQVSQGEKGVTVATALNTVAQPVQLAINPNTVIGSTTNGGGKPIANAAVALSATTAAKTIPVLINTTSGKRLANVPVSSLLSSSAVAATGGASGGSQASQKAVTYLVMPPQQQQQNSKAPTSLLVPQPLATAKQGHAAQMIGMTPKYQYIIQDDVPPIAKGGSAVVAAQVQDVNANSAALVQKGNEAWTLLATVNQQQMGNHSATKNGTSAATAKTVPLLIKSPVINNQVVASVSNTTALLQNSVVLSSRAPQSLIPKFVSSVAASQGSNLSSQSRSKQTVPIINTLGTSKGHVILGTATDNVLQTTELQHSSSHSSLQTLNESAGTSLLTGLSSTTTDNGPSLGDKIVLSSIGSVSSGRNTPVTGRITPLHSLETSPSENTINIKITGSKVTRTTDEPRPRKASTSIGKFGALSSSWSDFSTQIGSRSEMNSPVAFGGSSTASPTSSIEPWSPASLQIKSDSELDVSMDSIIGKSNPSSRATANAKRTKNRSASVSVDLTAIKSGATNTGRLHPLIDHDYCSFKQFIAEIQSSIIATTESKQKIEKYNQKAKAARTKDTLFKLDKNAKYKKRKYNHRSPIENIRNKIRHEKLVDRTDISLSKPDSMSPLSTEPRTMKSLSKNLSRSARRHTQAALERKSVKMRHVPRRGDGKNYVKITGSYQDDFVYYATKHSRGRPRKYHDATTPETFTPPKPVKKPAVGGINVFDWYRDLSQTDKSSRFGIPESPSAVSLPETATNIEEKPAAIPPLKVGQTPIHESEVADLVISMLPQEDFAAATTTAENVVAPTSIESLNQVASVSSPAPSLETETIVTHEVNNELHAMNEVAPTDVTQQEEIDQVLSRLINTMDESYLDNITEKLNNDLTPPPPPQNQEIAPVSDENPKTETPPETEVKNEEKSPSDVTATTENEKEPVTSKVELEVKEEKVDVETPSDPTANVTEVEQEIKKEETPEVKIEEQNEAQPTTVDEQPGSNGTPSKMLPSIEASDLSALLGDPYSQAGPSLSQTSAVPFDLDDINDDLLMPSDIGNMNALIGDLARSTSGAGAVGNTAQYSTATIMDGGETSSANDAHAEQPPLPEDFHFNNSLVKGELPASEASAFIATNAVATLDKMEANTGPLSIDIDAKAATASTSGPLSSASLQSTTAKMDAELASVTSFVNDVTRSSVAATSSACPSPVQRPPELIVVSMFWNDLPGLMIEGKRCVRLVDIHKQMLPAKDTGILKKRCQMMGLEVMACNEMERDFLIRYANAAKSKSCVVVAKDDAEALINFYVNPRPRVLPRQSTSGGGSRESSAERGATSEQSLRLAKSGASTPSTESDVEYEPPLPVSKTATGGKGKGKGKARPQQNGDRAATPASGKAAQKRKQSPLAAPPPPPTHIPISHEGAVTHTGSTPLPVSPSDATIKRSNRARTKVNYAALNAGLGPNNDGDENELPMDSGDEASTGYLASPEVGGATAANVEGDGRSTSSSGGNAARPGGVLRQNGLNGRSPNKMLDSDKYSFPEESEIRRLRNKQKRKGLNTSERRKLRRLKDRLKLKVKKLKKKLDRLKKTNGSQLVTSKNFLVKKALNNVSRVNTLTNAPVKSILLPGLKMRLQKEKVESQQLNNTTVPLTQVSSESLPQEPVVVKTKQDTKHVELVVAPNASVKPPTVVEEMAATSATSGAANTGPLPTAKEAAPSVRSPLVKEQPPVRSTTESVTTPRSSRRMSERDNTPAATTDTPRTGTRRPSERRTSVKSSPAAGTTPPTTPAGSSTKSCTKLPLPVLHRSNQRGRTQVGSLHVHLYRTRESACVQCETCSDFLSVRKFLKHLHHQNSVDELCMVTLPQKLELATLEPLPEQLKMWQQFESKRSEMDRTFEQNKANVSRAKAAAMVARRASATPTTSRQQTPRQAAAAKINKRTESTPASASTPLPPSTPTATVPACGDVTPDNAAVMPARRDSSGTRQSTRVRKRKQLHPMESYVYSTYTSPPNAESAAGADNNATAAAAKRRRLSSEKGFRLEEEESIGVPPVVACSNHLIHNDKTDVAASKLETTSAKQQT